MPPTSPTTNKSFLEIQMEQQKIAVSNPPPVPKQSGSVWNNPSTGNSHLPTRHTSGNANVWQTQPAIQQRLPRGSESDDDFWDLCMKDIPAAHRPTGLPQSHSGQTRTAAAKTKRIDKQEVYCYHQGDDGCTLILSPLQERIRSIFATPTANDDLVNWCESQFTIIHTELDGKIWSTYFKTFFFTPLYFVYSDTLSLVTLAVH